MYTYQYEMPAVTTTVVAFRRKSHSSQIRYGSFGTMNEVLLLKRSDSDAAYPGCWSLPGGFLDVGKECMAECAARELFEETGINIEPRNFTQFYIDDVFQDVDPRQKHVVNVCYDVRIENPVDITLCHENSKYAWGTLGGIINTNMELAFNHFEILRNFLLENE